jgi:PAS domain S-box-containing protein
MKKIKEEQPNGNIFCQTLSRKHYIFSFFTQLTLFVLTLFILLIEFHNLFNESADIPAIYIYTTLIISVIFNIILLVRIRSIANRKIKDKDEYQILVENQPDLIIKTDLNNILQYVNPSYCRLFEKSEEDLLGKSRISLVYEDDRKKAIEAMKNLQYPPHTYFVEQRVQTKKGLVWLAWKGRSILDEKGKAIGVTAVGRIINKQKEVEDKLNYNEMFLRNLINAIQDMIMIIDRNMTIVYTNKIMEDLYPHMMPLAGKKCFQRFYRGEELCDNCPVVRAFNTGKPQTETFLDKNCLSGEKWLQITSYPILDVYNNVINVIAIIRNIDNIMQMQEGLKRRNAILRAQQETAIDGILVIGEEIEIESYNSSFLNMWDITHEEIKEMSSKMLFEHIIEKIYNGQNYIQDMMYLLENPNISSYYDIKTKQNRTIKCYSAPVLSEENLYFGRVWYFRDITEMMHAESILRDNIAEKEKLLKQAVEYDRLKTEFFSNISHELRTPLNVIFSSIQLMNLNINRGLITASDDNAFRTIHIIKHNCYRLLKLINNLIDITKIDAGHLKPQIGRYNIVKLVEDISLSVSEYIESLGLKLYFSSQLKSKFIDCDVDMVERIMLNLLSNAVKFSKDKGKIWVKVYKYKDSVCISVRDNGIGIPHDKKDILFERFRQVNSSLNRQEEGSGIGLSLVKSLVELQGGRISVNSTLNIGTEFIFELPDILNKSNSDKLKNSRIKTSQSELVNRVNIEFSDIYK